MRVHSGSSRTCATTNCSAGPLPCPRDEEEGDWIFVIAVLSLLFVIVCAGLIVTVLVLESIGRFLFHETSL